MGLTLFHFFYESILAPSLRLQLRFRLFRLRDELRGLKIERDELSDRHFRYLQDSINTLIRNLSRFDVVTLIRLEAKLRRNPRIRERSEARCAALDECDLADVRVIRRKCNEMGVAALAVNSGGWVIYILPLVFLLIGFSALKRRITAVLSLSEKDFAKMAPRDLAASS
jgi:hypothetical protein